MKKILLLAAMLFAAATLVSAQNYKEYFVSEEVGLFSKVPYNYFRV